MSEEMLSRIRQNSKQLIADAYMAKAPHLSQGVRATFGMMEYFMQASCNITGQKNGANIWITSEQSIFRTKPLQNNWNDNYVV